MNRLLKKLTWTVVLSVGIGVFGGGFLSIYEDWLIKKDNVVLEIVSLTQVRAEPIKDAVPRKIILANLDINLDVVPGVIKNGEWQVSETKANYLVGSGVVGSESNMVIYAHRRPGLFADLSKAKIGDEVVVNGKDVKGVYQIFEMYETEVDNLSILDDTHESTLTLYTCYRWNDSTRYVVKAKLVDQKATSLIGVIDGVDEE